METEHRTILLIEDNEEVRENTAEILELADYEVILAENGKVGVTLAKEHLPDLIICDIMMPLLDGYGVLHILSRDTATAGIPFIFLTAKAEKGDFRKGMKMGADDYITKPFEELDLLETIERRLKKMAALQQRFKTASEQLDCLWTTATEQDLDSLSHNREHIPYPAKTHLFREGDNPHYLYLLNKGKVKNYMSNEAGKELILRIHKTGAYIGYQQLFECAPYNESAVALEDCEIVRIPKQEFFTLLYNNRDVARRFIKLLANHAEEQENRLLRLAYDSVRKRLAGALLQLQEPSGSTTKGSQRYSVSISREDLANLVGTSKETVIRTLSDFKREDLVITKGKYITVPNKKALEGVLTVSSMDYK